MKSELIKISRLKNNTGQIEGVPKNPRILKDDKYKKLVKSIQEDPEMLSLREVIAYDNNGELVVIAGNMRLKACKEAGLDEVPTKILPKDTPADKLKRYIIKDNNSFGEWSYDDLANEWDAEELDEWGVDLPSFADDFSDDFSLDDSEKGDFVQMTFILADKQSELIKEALNAAKGVNGDTFGNQNSNGNALYWIVEQWLSK